MKPVRFPQANRTLTKPQGMTDEDCGPLPTYSDGSQCISCWRMTWRERLRALFTGRVWLGVLSGWTQPPVWLSTERPFVERDVDGYQPESGPARPVPGGRTAAAVFLLAAGLLCGAAPVASASEVLMGPRVRAMIAAAQDAGSASESSKSPDARPAKVYVTAGYEFASSGETPNSGQFVGLIGGSAPIKVGKTYLRPLFRLSFQQLPGATVVDPANFDSLEGLFGIEKTISYQGGFRLAATCQAWINQKLANGSPTPPAVPATYGWGCGLSGHGDEGSHITVLAGTDTYGVPASGIRTGVQVRSYARIAVPGTDVTTADGTKSKVGSILVDARLSFKRPVPVVATTPAPATPDGGLAPPGPVTVDTVILYGVAIEAAPLWSKLVHKS